MLPDGCQSQPPGAGHLREESPVSSKPAQLGERGKDRPGILSHRWASSLHPSPSQIPMLLPLGASKNLLFSGGPVHLSLYPSSVIHTGPPALPSCIPTAGVFLLGAFLSSSSLLAILGLAPNKAMPGWVMAQWEKDNCHQPDNLSSMS